MGLDITAYSGMIEAKGNEAFDNVGDLKDDEVWFIVYDEPNFPGRCNEFKDGHAYKANKEFGFRAGSYSGYNQWRDKLAEIAGYGCAKNVLDNPIDGPFMELINFSDCEGTIGTEVSAKLIEDFRRYRNKAEAIGGVFWDKYQEWQEAFKVASNKGAVNFH